MRRKEAVSTQGATSKSLEVLRQRIDAVDTQLAALLADRLKLAKSIGKLKAELNLSIHDNTREKQVLERVTHGSGNTDIANGIKEIYNSIFAASKKLQAKTKAREHDTMVPSYFQDITIFGLGSVGRSLVQLIKETFPHCQVTGLDINKASTEELSHLGLIDVVATDLRKAIAHAGLIVLAASSEENSELLQNIAPLAKKRQIILDVSSVKEPIMRAAENLTTRADLVIGQSILAVGESHDARVEQSITFCLTPAHKSSELSVRRLIRWLSALGLSAELIDGRVYNKVLAHTSHCAQLLAIACGAEVASLGQAEQNSVRLLSGPAFKQLAALMKNPPEAWLNSVQQNSEQVINALLALEQQIANLRSAVATGDASALKESVAKANSVANRLE